MFEDSYIGLRGARIKNERRRKESAERRKNEQWATFKEPGDSIEAWKRGAVAFDILFREKDRHVFVLEIQGHDATVIGVENIPKEKLAPHVGKLAKAWMKKGHKRYPEPRFFTWITKDKRTQVPFIPKEHAPETAVALDETFHQLFEKYEKVIIKPHNGYQGDYCETFTTDQKEKAIAYAEQLTANPRFGGFVAQQFIRSDRAELASEYNKDKAQSLRIIVRFKINKGKLEILGRRLGYQRTAPTRATEVVNHAKLAGSEPMSDNEEQEVLPVATEVIMRLREQARKEPEYLKEVTIATEEAARKISQSIRHRFPLHVNLYPGTFGTNVEKARRELHFLHRLQEEMTSVHSKIWNARALGHRNRSSTLRYIDNEAGELLGEIDLYDRMNTMHTYTFSLGNIHTTKRTYEFSTLLEKYVLNDAKLFKQA